MQIENKISKHFTILLLITIAANSLGLINDILEPDGALYATISKNIIQKNNWINLYAYGNDWLDKPHFPFWVAALFIKVFGATPFAYKFPSFLCFLISVYYTYKLSLQTCCKATAEIATLIYTTALHIILCNFDVRAEIYLTAFITPSIYYLINAQEKKSLINIVRASFFTALALMTKGIFVFIIIGSGFVLNWFLSKQYKQLLNIKWYLYVFLSLVFILPELYCLYVQFDLHPEKIVFGKTYVSGLKFFFWDSQFGRFFNNGPIQGNGDIFFFLHTTLWAFLPWSFFVVLAILKNIKKIRIFKASNLNVVYGCAIFSFILFSTSKFQLPHYIVIIFPLLSILVANYIRCSFSIKAIKNIHVLLNICFIVLCLFILLLVVVYRFNNNVLALIFLIASIIVYIIYFKKTTLYNAILKGICFSVLLSLFLNFVFYPNLVLYQAGMMAGKWQQKNYKNEYIFLYRIEECSFEYYCNTTTDRIKDLSNSFKKENKLKLLTQKSELNNINKDSFKLDVLQYFPYFHITELKYDFINYKTRPSTLDSICIVQVEKRY